MELAKKGLKDELTASEKNAEEKEITIAALKAEKARLDKAVKGIPELKEDKSRLEKENEELNNTIESLKIEKAKLEKALKLSKANDQKAEVARLEKEVEDKDALIKEHAAHKTKMEKDHKSELKKKDEKIDELTVNHFPELILM
jgi:hypothetical protein